MLTKEQLKGIMSRLFYYHNEDILERYDEYKRLGCDILASALTTTIQFKVKYYDLKQWYYCNSEMRQKIEFMQNIDEPKKDSYSTEEVMLEIRKLPESSKLKFLFCGSFMPEEFPNEIYDAFLNSFESKEEFKRFVEKYPNNINTCGMYNNIIFLQAFIDAGVDIRLGDKGEKDKDDALYWAIHNGSNEAARMLLDAGCVLTDKMVQTATEFGNPDTIELCTQYGGDFTQLNSGRGLYKAVNDGDTEMIRALLNAGVDPAIDGYKSFPVAYRRMIRGKERDKYRSIYELLQATHIKRVIMQQANNQNLDNEMKLQLEKTDN